MVRYQLFTSCSLIFSISVLPKATYYAINIKKPVLKEANQPHAPWQTATSAPAIRCDYEFT